MEEDTRRDFSSTLLHAKGALVLITVSTLVAFGLGCVIGLVPSTITDRYATLHDSDVFNGHCSDFVVKPAVCIAASDEAERVATVSNFCLNMLTLLFNPLFGSYSDSSGRRPVILISLFLSLLPSIAFLLLLKTPRMSPLVYYTASALTGLVNFPSIAFATLSDVMPEEFRARSFGVLLAGFFGGYSLAPSIAVVAPNPITLASISLALILAGFLLAVLFLPETADLVSSARDPSQPPAEDDESSTSTVSPRTLMQVVIDVMFWPFRELHILFENWSIRLLALANVLSAMVFASDVTLVIYYIQDKFQVTASELAGMCIALGIAGMLVQGVLLQPMIGAWGEHRTLILSFICGCLHNVLYGLAHKKTTVCLGMVLSQLTKANFPLLSSIASRHASSHQGRMQGALFATSGLGMAIGPLTMKWLQEQVPTADPGIMFIYAAGLYFIGTVLVTCLHVFCGPRNEVLSSSSAEATGACGEQSQRDLQQPLLGETGDAILQSSADSHPAESQVDGDRET